MCEMTFLVSKGDFRHSKHLNTQTYLQNLPVLASIFEGFGIQKFDLIKTGLSHMFAKIRNSFTLPKIRQQINLIYLLSSIIPICIFGLFAIHTARTQMLEQYKSQLKTDALRVNSTLFDITTTVRNSTAAIVDNEAYWALFNDDYEENSDAAYQNLVNYLSTFYKNTTAISSICMYTDNPSIPEGDYVKVFKNGFDALPWYQNLDESTYNTWTCARYEDRFKKDSNELTLVEKIILKNSPYNTYLVTRLDNNYIRNRLLTGNNLIMASVDDNSVFFSSNRSWIFRKMPCSDEFENKNYSFTGECDIDGTSLLTSIVTFNPYETDNRFYILVSDKSALKDINHIIIIYLVILLFATVVPLMLVLFFSSYMSGRITVLKQAMHQASLGDYNIIDKFHGDDELADTFRDLKTTVELIHDKESKFYEAQLKEQQLVNTQQQMEFKMLASQINPHFLYNTLETIRMQAISNGNRDVADSINLLGKTMHYVLENTGTDSTTIAQELAHVTTYLKIQKLRFGDRVNYEVNVPPYLNLEQLQILPLLLQPIVENAIIHGLEGVIQNGKITINFILEEPNLYIIISDNGEGMDEETIEKLRRRIRKEDKHSTVSIGLRNIENRLRMLYGDEYGLTIESTVHEGTSITMTLPLSKITTNNALSEMILLREEYINQGIALDD